MRDIKYPYEAGICEKCIGFYLLEGNEPRCRKIKILASDAMCARVAACDRFISRKLAEAAIQKGGAE